MRSYVTIEPPLYSVATTSVFPSSLIAMSPVVITPVTMSESKSWGQPPLTSQMLILFPCTCRTFHVVVYAMLPRTAISRRVAGRVEADAQHRERRG